MRVLIDTCIFTHFALDRSLLSQDVLSILEDYDNVICVSAETPRELIIQYNNGKVVSKYWKSAKEMIDAIENEYYIHILPLKEEHMKKYSELELNIAQDHKDPSDHVIIAHAITEGLPLISDDRKFEFYRKQGLDLIINSKKNG
jgi:PIN domain nuclease of toxin-antitoxin system